MTYTFEEDSYDEPIILEREVKAALKVLGRNKSPGLDGIVIEIFQATETEFVKILTRACQQIWKNKAMPFRLEALFYIPLFKKGGTRSSVTPKPLL